jgi:hypothetical protein
LEMAKLSTANGSFGGYNFLGSLALPSTVDWLMLAGPEHVVARVLTQAAL